MDALKDMLDATHGLKFLNDFGPSRMHFSKKARFPKIP
jgi:hypothetical protein